MRILMSRPSLTETELHAVKAVFDSGWLGEGKSTYEFEEKLREFTGAAHAIAVNTGTSALHLSLASRGISPGDEVILPSFTFASDVMAVHLCGATPIFADIHPTTLNLDPQAVKPLITEQTRAILPTDYAGLPADIPGLRKAAGRDDILLIRDASHSFGSRLDGHLVGLNHGEDATCFSFDPIKNLTCGEGGALLVHDSAWASTLTTQRQLGFQHNAWTGLFGGVVQERRVTMTGYRYHMSNLNAAIGLAQFERLPELLEGKRRVARRYDEQLGSVSDVSLFKRDYNDVVPFIYPILVDHAHRDNLIHFLGNHGIHAGVRYFPCHLQPFFASSVMPNLPVTERLIRGIVCLPVYTDLKDEEVDEVVEHIQTFFNRI